MIARRFRVIRPSTPTWWATILGLLVMSATAAFLISRYPALPAILPVHFNRADRANGWQYKTYARVLMPVLVQWTLALIFGTIAVLLLSRSRAPEADDVRDLSVASSAAETVALVAAIWISFQAYASLALVRMWERGGGGLGLSYNFVLLTGVVLSGVVGVRARGQMGRPERREFVADHWRFGRLYRNPADPALFVPGPDGAHWTLNFGRPVAAVLLALSLGLGVLGPLVIVALLLR